ncbi:Uma2 family endonuclease [Streptomyces inhibens]|uniref:Uma2 family endonuclease n=1 Tax=Streptomyces inhibens TaxID=2293571 RepID=UPI001EE6FCDA|nr:Uma2 family endonuclease [Streptomyces inhibens]UKY52440.1 Uma2 family endonuclease [Streptomyces inhibens]
MSAAPVEPPHQDEPLTQLAVANRLMEQNPGHRVEIIGGVIVVTPPPNVPHERALKKIAAPLAAAGLDDGEESEVFQGIGVWLPDGPEDYAIPDLCLVDADIDDHKITNNCYDPAAFRLVLEVTSNNYNNDLKAKVIAYANAKIPVYVIIDRKHNRIHVLTDPAQNGYDSHRVHAPGEQITLPPSIGAEVKLDVEALLKAGQPRA